MKPKIIAIVQARTGSTRLPNKVITDICGKTLLERVVNRVQGSKFLDKVIVATTFSKGDDAIEALSKEKGWEFHRDIEGMVLEQFYAIALKEKADAIVRITADCAVIDTDLIDCVISQFLDYYPDIDYGSNILPRSYPRGLDTEIIKFKTLEREWRESSKWRNHVTMNLRSNYWNYKTCNIANDSNYSFMRWVIDTAEDLEFIRKIYSYFGENKFDWIDMLALLRFHSDWVIMDTQKDPE